MQNRTDRRGSRFRGLIPVACVAAAAVIGCKEEPSPPLDPFDVEHALPPKPGQPAPKPPAKALAPWRVWINQEKPRQKKNPHWRPYEAKTAAMLDIAEDGKWRCLVTAARLFASYDEHASIREWTASRRVRCSVDGWKTYVESYVRSGFRPDGTPTVADPPAPLYLHDVVNGQARSTVVVLAPLHKETTPVADD